MEKTLEKFGEMQNKMKAMYVRQKKSILRCLVVCQPIKVSLIDVSLHLYPKQAPEIQCSGDISLGKESSLI
jgi:hypothetical protein